MRVADVPTPALLVEVAAMERNIRRMAAFFAEGPCRLRPHFKAHKTPEIARRQLAAGACTGLTCATVGEAEVAAGLSPNILIANEPIGRSKCDRIAALAAGAELTVAVDSAAGLAEVAAAARRAGVAIGVLVDLNVGQNRCGVAPGADAVTLARRVAATRGVVLRGLMGYEGHLVAVPDRIEREARARRAMRDLVDTSEMLQAAGLPSEVVSAGGTGTYDISGRIAGITEIQAGSYVLMDSDYGRLDVPFEQAFWVLGTVISRPDPARCVADCGHKSMTKDHGLPTVRDLEGATVVALHDEHATIALPPDAPVRVGDRVHLRPSHTDPTINLHDVFYAIEGDHVVGVWPIAARGYSEHRSSATVR
ncbi:MAG: DSD1 family PLP-dependent enzyme [Acidobacteria bacterium]|nr:DSD1 family PLP-dependent enzyme [Acidobacteriota bacterium]